jgi:prepilin-type N-terminal cleavage/methylation domain-containing protein
MRNQKLTSQNGKAGEAGFTLVELLVTAAVFVVVSGAAFALLASHQPIFYQQQNLAEVNIALRNAVAQMQLDLANAGANYYASVNVPNYPVGVVVKNNVVASGGDCRSGTPLAYGTNCFDSLSIIMADANTLPTTPSNGSGACVATSGSTIYLTPAGATTFASAAAARTTAANYLNGDQILLVRSDGSQYTTVKLSAAGGTTTVGGNFFVTLTHGVTSSITDTTVTPNVTYTGYNTTAGGNDPYGMTTNINTMLNEQYCPTAPTDYVLRLTPIQYSVDTSTPTNPILTRTVAGTAQTLSQKTLATQIIGFKLGVSLFNNATDTDTTTYSFDASNYNNGNAVPYNYTLVRSVMVSLIGRTTPTSSPTYVFRNSFDSGAYQIQGVSAVINPRNLSMTD